MDRGKRTIPERVRAQLLALGIPSAEHTREGLVGFFPAEFNIAASGLDAADLAKVLVHFADRGLVSVSEGGARGVPVKRVQPGWHFCQFYRDFDELLALVAPYVAEGLHAGEGCLWVVPAAVTRAEVRRALAPLVDDVDDAFESGRLEVLSHPRWYLDDSGRLKAFEEVASALLRKQDAALAKGLTLLRAAGDTGWVSGTEQSRDFVDYEMKVNEALRSTQIAAVCTYRADVTADELVAIVAAHQDALLSA